MTMSLYPVVVTSFDERIGEVSTRLLSAASLDKAATGVNISNLLLEEFEKLGVTQETWKRNCLSLGTDNAPTMVGLKDGMLGNLRKVSPDLIGMGCPCHLINIAAQRASETLPVAVDELLTDIFYYLEKSKKRKQSLQQFQQLCDVDTKKILKHVCTRWLSLGPCLERLTENWIPLLHFFEKETEQSTSTAPAKTAPRLESFKIPKTTASASTSAHDDKEKSTSMLKKRTAKATKRKADASTESEPARKNSKCEMSTVLRREERIYSTLKNPAFLAYAHFLKAVANMFELTNKVLQAEKPLIHCLKDILEKLLFKVMTNFIVTSALKGKAPMSINYKDRALHKEEKEIFIGNATSALLETFSKEQKDAFYMHVKLYYTTACDYMVAKFPLRSEALAHAQVSNVSYAMKEGKWENINFFVKRFPSLLLKKENETDSQATDQLQNQFQEFQLADLPLELPDSDLDREDRKWVHIGKMKQFGAPQFDRLAKVMLGILTLPHSNASCERIFSQIRKNKTDFRGSMGSDTLNAIIIAKANTKGHCYTQKFSRETLEKAKSATAIHLSQNKSNSTSQDSLE